MAASRHRPHFDRRLDLPRYNAARTKRTCAHKTTIIVAFDKSTSAPAQALLSRINHFGDSTSRSKRNVNGAYLPEQVNKSAVRCQCKSSLRTSCCGKNCSRPPHFYHSRPDTRTDPFFSHPPLIAAAQYGGGPYMGGPGPYYGDRYRERDNYYDNRYRNGRGYYPPGRYRTVNGCQRGWTVQDGLCKPYRGY